MRELNNSGIQKKTNKNRVQKEADIVRIMIDMYCKGNHSSNIVLCNECEELATYAESRALNCKFGNKKPVCGKCKIHCYKPSMREKIKKVMRYSGPRMIIKHPVVLAMHAMDLVIY